MVQNFRPNRKDDEIRVKMDITVDLPAEVAEQAERMGICEFDQCTFDEAIMEQMKATEGVTEELKRTQQMEWVQRCNNIHNRAEEIVLHDIIYSYGSN